MLNRGEHEKYLSRILLALYSDKMLANALGFKGGTACYFLYNLPRFSTDLDFNLVKPELAQEVDQKIVTVLPGFGEIKDRKIKFSTIYFLFSYSHGSHNIKIEISTRSAPASYELSHLLGLPILTMTQDYMAANKLVAILARKRLAHRDLFDAWFFLKNNWPINEQAIQSRTGLSKKVFFSHLADELEKMGEINILHGLGEVLEHYQKIWAKQNLLQELIFLLRINAK